ncbi:MAG TPA: SLC13 family permease [Candidatus Hydrogenedentes bacterium]|nr:SLC13 family permease [Candidatus Hydrogenedentota bacterium]HOS02851.1 SLC13 family permease [Candidatus Hydrogenedentota bacterium]
MNEAYVTLAIFVAAYVLFVVLPTRRSLVACGGALLLLFSGVMSPLEAFLSINWNVMGIFVGMLVMADVFIESRCPAYLAECIVNRAPSTAWALLFICALTGAISMFVENVATVLIIAPIAIEMTKRLQISPVATIIGIAISSNLQGTATLIGDPPSMLLGGYAKMTFMDFFFYQGKPSIFFAVELGALASFVVLYMVFRRHGKKMTVMAVEKVESWTPAIALVLLIAALALSSFFDKEFSYMAGGLCMLFAAAMVIWAEITKRGAFLAGIKRLDWDTTFFLLGIFVIVHSLSGAGWIDRISTELSDLIGGNIFLGYTILVFLSVAISAFVDNVPFLAAMLPVAISLSERLHINPTLFLFGLLIGASLGGNVTPIGASANIVGMGLLRKEGCPVTFRQWAMISIPFTIAAVLPAYLLVWFIWS